MERMLTPIAVGAAIVVALTLPLGYLFAVYRSHTSTIEAKVLSDVALVQEILAAQPPDWRERVEDIQDKLRAPEGSNVIGGHTVIDAGGKVVGRDERRLAWPTIERERPLVMGGDRIGTFVISRSLRSEVEEMLLAAVLGVGLGVLVFASLGRLPRAAKEAARKQATLDALINSIPYSIFYKSTDGTYLGCNEAFGRIAGKRPADMVNRNAIDLFGAERGAVINQADRDMLSDLQAVHKEEQMRYPDGAVRLMQTVKAPFWDADGRLIGIMGIGHDITLQRKFEQEIQAARLLAEEAAQMKSDFLANMSHEIRTPMNAIIGLTRSVLKADDLTDHQRDHIRRVESSGQHLMRIIDDILDFSKVEAGKLAIEAHRFELDALLENVANLVGDKARAKGLDLVFDVAPDVPGTLVGDALRLGQVLINFANNAVKFTQEGRIVVDVRVSAEDEDGLLLRFCVADTGIGLTEEQMGRLFQSFHQADASTTRKFGGTGLGLAISKRLAELMGGEVGVESQWGRGSAFWFTARVQAAHGAGAETEPAPLSGAGVASLKGLRVLLVEDNDINQIVATEILSDVGMVVDVAGDGQVALEMAQRSPYDVVLMDMQMPVMDGLTATREIRRIERLRDLPIIAMTANAMEQDRRNCLEAGMNGHVAKPIEPDDLFAELIRHTGARMLA